MEYNQAMEYYAAIKISEVYVHSNLGEAQKHFFKKQKQYIKYSSIYMIFKNR